MIIGFILLLVLPGQVFAQGWHIPGNPDEWSYGYHFAEQTSRGRHLGVDIILPPGTPIVALFDGVIKKSQIDGDPNGYGPYVVYEYTTPIGTKHTRVIGHLSKRTEYPGKALGPFNAGDILGYVGFDDENGSGGPHIHEADYGAPYVEYEYHYYGYAPNSSGDDVDYDINGNYIGGKFTDPIKLWEPWISLPTYLYLVASQFQSSWNESVHGFAVTPAYQWGNLLRQDFQSTIMTYNASNGSVIIDGNNWICPGMTQSGWDWSVTPYFIKAYNDHGRANAFGNAYSDAGNPRYAHLWGEYWIQNWNGGNLGDCAITLDPSLSSARKQAAPIHGELWDWFRYNNGPYYMLSSGKYLGCPIEPEEYANVGVNYDVIQLTSNGYLYWDESAVTAEPRITVGAALLPSDGVILRILADALSSTSVYLTSSLIDNAVMYAVYEDNVLIGYLDPSNLELTVDGLEPGSTHTYEVVAYDQNGNELASAISEPVILPQTPGVGTMPISVSTGTMSAEVSHAGYPGAITYYVFLDDVLKAQVTTLFATIYGMLFV